MGRRGQAWGPGSKGAGSISQASACRLRKTLTIGAAKNARVFIIALLRNFLGINVRLRVLESQPDETVFRSGDKLDCVCIAFFYAGHYGTLLPRRGHVRTFGSNCQLAPSPKLLDTL